MIYSNTKELIEILKKENFWTKKHLGQNFLINNAVVSNIIKAAELSKEDYVVEVGPGLGILTRELSAHAGKVRSIELDPNLIELLKREFTFLGNIELEQGNALKAKLPTKPYKLVANIPYYITSPLLNHFLQPQNPREKRPDTIVLLVQKEVAEKICADVGSHSVLSLSIQIFGQPKIVHKVSASDFYPQPKVESAILKIKSHAKPLTNDPEQFMKIIKAAFAQRRKTLLNSLQNGLKLDKEVVVKALINSGIDSKTRPQMLSIENWKILIKKLPKIH